MSAGHRGTRLRQIAYGLRVDRATGNLPQSTTGTIFTVAIGRVILTSLVGVVTTSIQAQADAIKAVATPTVGAVNDLSATVDVNGLAAGGLLSILGLAGDAALKSTGGGISLPRNGILVAPGAIGINAAASNTGQIQWTATYMPLDDGATLVAA